MATKSKSKQPLPAPQALAAKRAVQRAAAVRAMAKAAAKTKAAQKPKAKATRFTDAAKFVVDLAKSDRREGCKGIQHLKRLQGKTYGQARGTDWFTPYRLKRDIRCGALRIVEA